jgi:hypothetical protein
LAGCISACRIVTRGMCASGRQTSDEDTTNRRRRRPPYSIRLDQRRAFRTDKVFAQQAGERGQVIHTPDLCRNGTEFRAGLDRLSRKLNGPPKILRSVPIGKRR